MPRPIIEIDTDLYYVRKAIEQHAGNMRDFERYCRRRNELLIEREQALNPVHKQREEIAVKQSIYNIIKHL